MKKIGDHGKSFVSENSSSICNALAVKLKNKHQWLEDLFLKGQCYHSR